MMTARNVIENPAQLNYREIIAQYPWVVEKDHNCIISPDSDGLLCGLLMSHYLGWHVRGFYDGKVLLVEQGVNHKECIFLDMEIFRLDIRSVGQHMVMFDKKALSPNWNNFQNCIAVNNLRNFDFKNDFKYKYPLGTIHLLLALLGQSHNISINKDAISTLLYTDGTFKNQFNYPENCISWLNFLGASQPNSPLQRVFLDPHYSTYELMVELNDLFSKIHSIGGGKRGGDKISISTSKGQLKNIDEQTGCFERTTQDKAKEFIKMLAEKTGWMFKPSDWSWGPFQSYKFSKGSVIPGKARYNDLLARNPISLAIISRASIEYTIDGEQVF